MPSYEAIFFDFDGVLLDSEPVHFACWLEIFQSFGFQLDWEVFRKHCIGVHDRPVVEFLCGLPQPPIPVGAVWAQYPEKKRLFEERMLVEPPFPRETIELLRSLDGYKLAVVSSSGRSEVEPILDAGGIRSAFEVLICAEDVGRHKPAPDPYLLAANLLNVTSALVVEDSDAGVESGRAAGFDVLRIRDASETAARVRAKLAV